MKPVSIIRTLTLAILIIPLTALSVQADLQIGIEAYKAGDYETAYREILPEAKKGDVEAQYYLGIMSQEGQGVAQDHKQAAGWYRKAAKLDHAKAQCGLANLYRSGQGVGQSDKKAVKWWRKAAEQGLAEAQHALGVAYADGRGVPRDDAEAVKWYRKAADQGDAEARYNLGYMHQMGRGVPRVDAEAEGFYFVVKSPNVKIEIPGLPNAELGPHPMGKFMSGLSFMSSMDDLPYVYSIIIDPSDEGMTARECSISLYKSIISSRGLRRGQYKFSQLNETTFLFTYESNLPSLFQSHAHLLSALKSNFCIDVHISKPSESQEESTELFSRFQGARIYEAADQGLAEAQSGPGPAYQMGQGVPQNDAWAVKWYRKAADQGNSKAQYNLGYMYQMGRGVPQDDAEAVRWYRKAADQGDASAQHALGVAFADGRGVPRDDAEAARWYRKAADQAHAKAQFLLGLMYADGRGVPQDKAEAVKWYRKAAEQTYAEAQLSLGLAYQEGLGVMQDNAEAVKWYRKAAGQGLDRAQLNLGFMYAHGYGVSEDDTEALNWYRKAAEQGCAEAQHNLGIMYANGEGVPKNYGKAITWLQKAIENNPENADSYNNQAWIFATCPERKYRDGDKAVELAKKAVELSPTPAELDTLAAAYAEAGQFEDAITTQEKAISLLRKANLPEEVISGLKERLNAYQAHKPWRER